MFCSCLMMLVGAAAARHKEEAFAGSPMPGCGPVQPLCAPSPLGWRGERLEPRGAAGSLRAVMSQHLSAMLSRAPRGAEASSTRAASMFINDCIGDAV